MNATEGEIMSMDEILTSRGTEDRDQVDQEQLSAAVGPNTGYYLSCWREMRAKGRRVSWNWAACLANLYWFAWRRMWGPLAWLVGAFVLVGILGALVPALASATLLITIGFTFVTGAYGNELYRRHCERLAAGTTGLDPEKALASLRRRGGTSPLALGITIVATLLLIGLPIAFQVTRL